MNNITKQILTICSCRRGTPKRYSLPPPLRKNSSVIAYQNPRMSSSDAPASGSYYNASPASMHFPNSETNSNYRSGSHYDTFPANLNGATRREQSSVSSHNSTVASVDSSNIRVCIKSLDVLVYNCCVKLLNDCGVLLQSCPVCLWNTKDLAFGCGHQVI